MNSFSLPVKTLKNIVDALKVIDNEAKPHFTPDGVEITLVDKPHIAGIAMAIQKETFSEYEMSDMEIALDLNDISEVLSLASPKDLITAVMGSSAIAFKTGHLTRTVPLLDPATVQTGIETFRKQMESLVPKLKNEVTLPKSEVMNGLKSASTIADSVTYLLEKDKFMISAKSDSKQSDLSVPKSMLKQITIEKGTKEVKATYPLEYMAKMVSAVSAENVTLSYNSNFPVLFSMTLPETNPEVKALCLIAPRIPEASQ